MEFLVCPILYEKKCSVKWFLGEMEQITLKIKFHEVRLILAPRLFIS